MRVHCSHRVDFQSRNLWNSMIQKITYKYYQNTHTHNHMEYPRTRHVVGIHAYHFRLRTKDKINHLCHRFPRTVHKTNRITKNKTESSDDDDDKEEVWRTHVYTDFWLSHVAVRIIGASEEILFIFSTLCFFWNDGNGQYWQVEWWAKWILLSQ